MSGLTFTYPTQDPAYTPVPNTSPTIVSTFQPTPVANFTTYSASNFTPQLLTRMQHMQQLLILMQTNKIGGGGKTNNCNIRHTTTRQSATEPRQGQPHKPLPYFTNKYFWTHGKCAHKGASCNNKAPRRQYSVTFCNKLSGSTYGRT